MPHYKDGSEAKVGDTARGHCHGTGRVTEGVVVSITPGADTCNCQLAYPALIQPGGRGDDRQGVTLATGWCTLKDLEKVGP